MRDRAVSSARGITTPQTIVSPRSIQFELCLATLRYIWIQIWRPSLSVSYLWSRWQVEKRRALFLKKNRGMAARAGLPWTVYRSLQSDRKLIRIDWFIHCFLVLKPMPIIIYSSLVGESTRALFWDWRAQVQGIKLTNFWMSFHT